MARKRLEQRVKQIIIQVGNIKEVIQLDSNERPTVSKDVEISKIDKMKKEIKKFNLKLKTEQQIKVKNMVISNPSTLIGKSPCIPFNHQKISFHKGNKEIIQPVELNGAIIKQSTNQANPILEKKNNEFDDYFDDYLFEFI